MDRNRPGLLRRGAAAFLVCFQTLALLTHGGRNRESGTKISVGIHTVSVAEKAKYRVVVRYKKRRRCTAWKKVATQDWDFTAEFAECAPQEMRKVKVELQKKKKCKEKTIGVTTLDPARALQPNAYGRPVKDWYVFDPPKKGRPNNYKNVCCLEATVAVYGPGKTTTQKTGSPTPKPSVGKLRTKPVSATELREKYGTKKTTSQTVGAKKLDKTNQGKPAAPSSGDNTKHKPASSSPSAANGSPSSTATNGAGDVKPSRFHRLFGSFTKKKSETTTSVDEGASTKPHEKTTGETVVTEDQLERSSEKEETKLALKSVSQPVEGEKPDKSEQDKLPDKPSSGSVERTELKPASPSTTSTSASSSAATDKSLTNGEGDAKKRKSERPSRFRQLVGFITKKDDSKTTTAIPTAKPPPPQFTDPVCKEVMLSIHTLWAELLPKRAHSKELLAYANTLMSKLEAAAPHTKDNTILKNLFARVPDYTHYELPEMAGLSLHELNQIQKTVVFLIEDEEKRTTYFRRWLIDDICRVALEEAPQILETAAPSTSGGGSTPQEKRPTTPPERK
ncbi:PREDICTED: uncharacterized protein LOC109480093 [Branchiostoma belcheri]|uniref:Uncharacterized protein LOC109480093 n=1 Tax=Branchiostoma belcheri TaxID=7741 RepID=A0A6P4Z8S9_BRABE|nr:PREDICTED: uncharacterized protein LOC109480093 [Branchiostoma belcheri]